MVLNAKLREIVNVWVFVRLVVCVCVCFCVRVGRMNNAEQKEERGVKRVAKDLKSVHVLFILLA